MVHYYKSPAQKSTVLTEQGRSRTGETSHVLLLELGPVGAGRVWGRLAAGCSATAFEVTRPGSQREFSLV